MTIEEIQKSTEFMVYATIRQAKDAAGQVAGNGDVNGGLNGQLNGQIYGQLNDSQKETFEFTPEGTQTNHHYIYKVISPPGWWLLFYYHKRHICKSVLIVLVHIIIKRMTHP